MKDKFDKTHPDAGNDPSAFIEFNDIYKQFYSGFVMFANSYLKDAVLAEDYVAEAFMAYWNNRSSLRPDANVRAYILTVLKNKCLNHLRQTSREQARLRNIHDTAMWDLEMRISTLEACDPKEIFSAEIQEIVDKTLSTLSEKTLKAFVLSRYENKSHKEIAEELGMTVKGVEFHITKALNIIRKELKDYLHILTLFL